MKIIIIIVSVLIISIFIFFVIKGRDKKNVINSLTENTITEELYNNLLRDILLQNLNLNYTDYGFKISNGKIVSDKGISIEYDIINHRKYPTSESFQINFLTNFKTYFRDGIEERLVGIGENDTTAINYGVQSFLSGQFPTIIQGINSSHSPDLDFDIISTYGKNHWHPIIGDIQMQGELSNISDSSIYEKTYKLLKPIILEKLKNSKENFHWMRYYISKSASNEIIGDCYFDNEVFEIGLNILKNYANNWDTKNKFAGQKQFILLRKCEE